ncbi:MAG: hypothetical protein EAX96_18420 [Candidatus Lokiarchaeota archaeon]|nr:hypothetical protein [Candidatus Lokiarchaeota archaeon]
MNEIITHNINQIILGTFYQPYKTLTPSEEEILKKYPHLNKEKTSKLKNKQKIYQKTLKSL